MELLVAYGIVSVIKDSFSNCEEAELKKELDNGRRQINNNRFLAEISHSDCKDVLNTWLDKSERDLDEDQLPNRDHEYVRQINSSNNNIFEQLFKSCNKNES